MGFESWSIKKFRDKRFNYVTEPLCYLIVKIGKISCQNLFNVGLMW